MSNKNKHTEISQNEILANLGLQYLSHAFMTIPQELGTIFLFEANFFSPLTFSLLQTQYKFDLLSKFDQKHISLNIPIGKYNTKWHNVL